MFYVEVFSKITPFDAITRYLVFDTYTTATNCVVTLRGLQPGTFRPEDFFEAAKIYKKVPFAEKVGGPIETYWVITYLEKCL